MMYALQNPTEISYLLATVSIINCIIIMTVVDQLAIMAVNSYRTTTQPCLQLVCMIILGWKGSQ